MDTFAPARLPHVGSRKNIDQKHVSVSFEGYIQTAPIGTNPNVEQWQLTYENLLAGDVAYIEDFYKNHIGQTFLYAVAGEALQKWQFNPASLSKSHKLGARYTLNVGIKQVFI